MRRACLHCGEVIAGRSDKKFCDDSCRSNYNSLQNREKLNYLREVNAILKKNRSVLENHAPDGKAKVKKQKLAASGYNFDFFTHQYTTAKGQTYFFCYEYGYLILSAEDLLLVKRDR